MFRHDGNKNFGQCLGKNAFLARKSVFFYATPIKPPFFGVRRIPLNGIISPPYPEVTLDNFGFPVGGRLAARRAVFQNLKKTLKLAKITQMGNFESEPK